MKRDSLSEKTPMPKSPLAEGGLSGTTRALSNELELMGFRLGRGTEWPWLVFLKATQAIAQRFDRLEDLTIWTLNERRKPNEL